LSLSPLDPFRFRHECFLSLAYFAADNFAEAAAWGLRSYERNTNYTANLRVTIASLATIGHVDQARELVSHLLKLQPQLHANESAARMPFVSDEKKRLYGLGLIKAGVAE
jgi:hypothetical protein